ncbi:MAG TPA: phage holin family protein [Actinoplanes sp.]|nr:phage holin family protein [Actinoplanes sp.]
MVDVFNGAPARPATEQSTSELVQRASEQITRLVKDELALAKAELTEKGKHAGIGVGLFGGGGVLALYGVGVLLVAFVLLLDLVLPAWAAALIVAATLFAVAGLLAVLGSRQVKQAAPPLPTEAAESVQADVDAVVRAAREQGARDEGARA